MNKKLTLSLNATVIEKAKVYAEKTGRSLSGMVENYLESLTKKEKHAEVSERLKKIAGKIKVPTNFDEKEELRKGLEEKYLR
jgi:macrodomain Ter protein organizer (MatP/YcbG family)